MGSHFSFLVKSIMCTPHAPEPSLGDLPESCMALVMEYMDPPDICRIAVLNRAFRRASSADFVWESKLPLNYDSIISRVFDHFPAKLCKRDIYARLCTNNSFDQGTKKCWLDKNTGRICLSISSSGLAITGIDDSRYWIRVSMDESRFGSIAYLQQIWWFQVDGELEFPFPPGTYSLFFRLHLGLASKRFGRRVCNSDDVHGWDTKPVQFQLSTLNSQQAISQCYLCHPGKWAHYHVGDFFVEDPMVTTKIKFSMKQIDCTHTKGGLCVDSVIIYPSGFREKLKHLLAENDLSKIV